MGWLNINGNWIGRHSGQKSWSSYWLTRKPSNFVVQITGETTATATWDDASVAADGLKIYVSTDGGVTKILKNTIAFGIEAANITGLTHNTDYTFYLVAYKGTNESTALTDTEKTLELWYLAGGVTSANCKGAYQPIEAASLAASKVNLITPGTNDAGGGTDPDWDAVSGWKFNGTSHYLKTGIVPENDQTWSMIVRYDGYTTGNDTIAGVYEDANKWFAVAAVDGSPGERIQGASGSNGTPSYKIQTADSGILAICGSKMYWNGLEIAEPRSNYPLPAGSGAITYDIWIGQVHYSSPSGFFDGNVQAFAVYDKVLSDDEVFAISSRMNQLGISERVLKQNYVNQGFGSLICFDMATFRGSTYEVGLTNGDVNTFAPTGLDIDQWLDAHVAAGMGYAILTSKHHCGFKLWDSAIKVGANQVYGINSTTWYANNGNPDIVGLFVSGCRARGLKVGLYFSIRDLTWENQTGKTQVTDTAGYIAMIEAELTELLTNYGNIDSMWFDGWGWDLGYTYIPYATIYNFVKGLQPNCVVVENSQNHPTTTSQIETYEVPVDTVIPAGNMRLSEEVNTIRSDGKWFYHPDLTHDASDFYSKTQINDAVTQANSRNGSYLIGLTPGTDGHLPVAQVELLESL